MSMAEMSLTHFSEGPRPPYQCVYMQDYMSKVGMHACINVYTCVCVHIDTQAKHVWARKYLKGLRIIGTVGKSSGLPQPPHLCQRQWQEAKGKGGMGEPNQAGLPLFHTESAEIRKLTSFFHLD